VFGAASGSDLAGSNGLIRQLRAPFVTFGVPEELSSNGGPEFRAAATPATPATPAALGCASSFIFGPVEW
jgi:hypothetical protein